MGLGYGVTLGSALSTAVVLKKYAKVRTARSQPLPAASRMPFRNSRSARRSWPTQSVCCAADDECLQPMSLLRRSQPLTELRRRSASWTATRGCAPLPTSDQAAKLAVPYPPGDLRGSPPVPSASIRAPPHDPRLAEVDHCQSARVTFVRPAEAAPLAGHGSPHVADVTRLPSSASQKILAHASTTAVSPTSSPLRSPTFLQFCLCLLPGRSAPRFCPSA